MSEPLPTIPPAWMVLDARGRPALFLDHGRALQAAADHHGQLFELVPLLPDFWRPSCSSHPGTDTPCSSAAPPSC